MIKNTYLRKLAILIALVAPASAGVVEDVRATLAQNNFSSAEAQLSSYRSTSGVTPEYIEAYSWMGRAALSAHEYDQAAACALRPSQSCRPHCTPTAVLQSAPVSRKT